MRGIRIKKKKNEEQPQLEEKNTKPKRRAKQASFPMVLCLGVAEGMEETRKLEGRNAGCRAEKGKESGS